MALIVQNGCPFLKGETRKYARKFRTKDSPFPYRLSDGRSANKALTCLLRNDLASRDVWALIRNLSNDCTDEVSSLTEIARPLMNSLPLCTVDPIHYRMNHNKPSNQPSAKRGQELTRRVARVRKDLIEQSRNPQALERKRQAADMTRLAAQLRVDAKPRRNPKVSVKGRFHAKLSAYAHQVASPRDRSTDLVPPPYTDNAAQTVQATQCRTVGFHTFTVPANRTIQISLFSSGPPQTGSVRQGGFDLNLTNDGAPQDLVATHNVPLIYRDVTNTVHYRHVGPIPTYDAISYGGSVQQVSVDPTLGVMNESTPTNALPLGKFTTYLGNLGDTGNVRWRAVDVDSRPPYQGNIPGHARFCNTGMEIELINTTQQAMRGGNIISVAPPHEYNPGIGILDQEQLARFKTFKSHAIDAPARIIVPPRANDMVYSHPKSNIGAAVGLGWTAATASEFYSRSGCASVTRASMHVLINNPTVVDQFYTYEVISLWSIGGDLTSSIAQEVTPALETKPAVVAATVAISQAPVVTPGGVLSAFVEGAARTGHEIASGAVKAASIARSGYSAAKEVSGLISQIRGLTSG